MNISNVGISLIITYEGFRSKMYYDAVGKPTIGYGTLIDSANEQYLKTATITKSQAIKLLLNDVAKFEKKINDNLKATISQNQYDALVSFGYNLGYTPLLLMVTRLNNGWSNQKVAAKINLYNKAGGKVLTGLVRRRKQEVELFLTAQKSSNNSIKNITKVSLIAGSIFTVYQFLK